MTRTLRSVNSVRRTIFGSIGDSLRRKERQQADVVETTGRLALQRFLNDNVQRAAVVDYRRNATPSPVFAHRETVWGLVYDDRTEWLIPLAMFDRYCRAKLKVDTGPTLASALASGAIIPGPRNRVTQVRPVPGVAGAMGEFVVFSVEAPKELRGEMEL